MKKKMDEDVKKYLEEYSKQKGWGTDEATLIEIVTESKSVYREERSAHRWWDIYYYVVDIGGKLIGYCYARTTGDKSAEDTGYEMDLSTIGFAMSYEETVTVTKYKNI